MTRQQIAGYKAAHTRRINEINEQVTTGVISTRQGAARKAVATRRLNSQIGS